MYNPARFSQEEQRNRARSIHNASYLVILRIIDNIQIHPLIARSHHRPHSGPLSGPDATQDRFETDAVFILTPEFNARLWIRLMQLLDLLREFF